MPKKKRPPTPPRKPKVNKNLGSFLSYDNKNESQSVITSSVPNTPDVETHDLIDSLLTDSKVETNLNNESIVKKDEQNNNLSKNRSKDSEPITTTSLDDSILYDDDEDNIYDTVAPDEPSAASNSVNNNKKQSSDVFDIHSSTDNLSAKYYDLNSYANYVNIDYFLRKDETSSRDDSDDNETQLSQSLSSDHEIDDNISQLELIKSNIGPIDMHSISSSSLDRKDSVIAPTYDEVFELDSPLTQDKLDNEVN